MSRLQRRKNVAELGDSRYEAHNALGAPDVRTVIILYGAGRGNTLGAADDGRRRRPPDDRANARILLDREGANRHLADRRLIFNVLYSPADLREGFNESTRPPRFNSEAFGDTRVAVTVPTERFLVLELCRLNDPYRLQRPSTSRSTRGGRDERHTSSRGDTDAEGIACSCRDISDAAPRESIRPLRPGMTHRCSCRRSAARFRCARSTKVSSWHRHRSTTRERSVSA